MSADRKLPESVEIFDTTLRDGCQLEGISVTVDDKLRIAEQLDLLGVHYIEGGWPGANPKDEEFFRRAATELRLETSTLVAFGSTRGRRAKSTTTPRCATSSKRAPARWYRRQVVGLPRHRGLQTTLDEGEASDRRQRAFLSNEGAAHARRRAPSTGTSATPSSRQCVLEAAVVNGASISCCATPTVARSVRGGGHRRRCRRPLR
jgi:2-isopropylmalate synthase